jgi:hypothetical protein
MIQHFDLNLQEVNFKPHFWFKLDRDSSAWHHDDCDLSRSAFAVARQEPQRLQNGWHELVATGLRLRFVGSPSRSVPPLPAAARQTNDDEDTRAIPGSDE